MNIGGFSIDFATLATLITALATLVASVRNRIATRELRQGQLDKGKKIDAIEHEVTPNGGGSLRDAINRIEKTVGELVTAQKADDELHKQGEKLAEDVLARLVVLERRPWTQRFLRRH